MRFRNLDAEELDGSVDIPGLREWLNGIGATDATILITAPPGTGKAAAVGRLARRLGRGVLLCNLLELFDHDDPAHQLENLLRLCGSQRQSVIYLDKLDKALAMWSQQNNGKADDLEATLCNWLRNTKEILIADECTVVFTARDTQAIPTSLSNCFDKALSG